jgi:hypothetical protein
VAWATRYAAHAAVGARDRRLARRDPCLTAVRSHGK